MGPSSYEGLLLRVSVSGGPDDNDQMMLMVIVMMVTKDKNSSFIKLLLMCQGRSSPSISYLYKSSVK